jgi:hypothetical protein
MTTKHTGGDDAATLYALADALHGRAAAQYRDALQHAQAGEWEAAESAMQAARTSKTAADELTAEADAS